eukprot:13962602-Ditylum_brightwellii.AAC.1
MGSPGVQLQVSGCVAALRLSISKDTYAAQDVLEKHHYILCCQEEVGPGLRGVIFVGDTKWFVAMMVSSEVISLVEYSTEASISHGGAAHIEYIISTFAFPKGVL